MFRSCHFSPQNVGLFAYREDSKNSFFLFSIPSIFFSLTLKSQPAQNATFKENKSLSILQQSTSKAESDVLQSCQPILMPTVPIKLDFTVEIEYQN